MLLQLQFIPDSRTASVVPFRRADVDRISGSRVSGEVHLNVIRATRLRSAQLFGTQDPFVELQLLQQPMLPPHKQRDPTAQLKGGAVAIWPAQSSRPVATTAKVDGGQDVEWREQLLVPYTSSNHASAEGTTLAPTDREGYTPLVRVTVRDRGSTQLTGHTIGSILLPILPFMLLDEHLAVDWLPLYSPKRGSSAYAGRIRLGAQFIADAALGAPTRPNASGRAGAVIRLRVVVLEARALPNIDATGDISPYAVLQVANIGSASQTSTQSGPRPRWDEHIDIPVDLGELSLTGEGVATGGGLQSGPVLQVGVWDKNSMRSDKLIGRQSLKLPLPSALKHPPVSHDALVKDLHNQAVDAWVALQGTDKRSGQAAGEVRLRMEWVVEDEGKGELTDAEQARREQERLRNIGGAEPVGEGLLIVDVVAAVGLRAAMGEDHKKPLAVAIAMVPGGARRHTRQALLDKSANLSRIVSSFTHKTTQLSVASTTPAKDSASTAKEEALGLPESMDDSMVWQWMESLALPCPAAARDPTLQLALQADGITAGTSTSFSVSEACGSPLRAFARWVELPSLHESASAGSGCAAGVLVAYRFVPHVQGKFVVSIVEADCLQEHEAWTKQNPYVTVQCRPGRIKMKTSVAEEQQDMNARWPKSETMTFEYSSSGAENDVKGTAAALSTCPRLICAVMHDRLLKDTLAGAVDVSLVSALANPAQRVTGWHSLTSDGGGRGTTTGRLRLWVKFMPQFVHADAARDGAAETAIQDSTHTTDEVADGTADKADSSLQDTSLALTTAAGLAALRIARMKALFYRVAGEDKLVSLQELVAAVKSDEQLQQLLSLGGQESNEVCD